MLSVAGIRSAFVVSLFLLVGPTLAFAQNNIAGVVKDTSGAVLPGVTVEAASPALIEKVRSVITNDQGLYQIVDLRPGDYTVTFTLPGFNTVKRDGIVLTGSQTFTVHAEMRVGALEETITVSGESPVVDVQTVTQHRSVTAQVVDTLPSGRSFGNLAVLLPGVVGQARNRPAAQDVGGLSGERNPFIVHGGRTGDMAQLLDGLTFTNFNNQGSGTQYNINPAEIQEFAYDLGAGSVEQATGGVRMNAIPKEGGNQYKGYVFFNFANSSLQTNNLSDELRGRGFSAANRIKRLSDINPAIGGPLKRDKLWFFFSGRYNELKEYTGGFHDTSLTDFVYTPDPNSPAVDNTWASGLGLRLTYQANERNKFSVYTAYRDGCTCPGGTTTSAPEAQSQGRLKGVYLTQVSWNSPVTSRLLLEAGMQRLLIGDGADPEPGVTPDMYSISEQTTGLLYRAATFYKLSTHRVWVGRAALSYVTGAHVFKTGFDIKAGRFLLDTWVHQDINVRVANGIPNQVTLNTTPYTEIHDQNAGLGLYAQDRWTLKRATVTAGLRLDYHNASVPAQELPAARYVPARSFSDVPDVPNWKDLSPRLGFAYDLFGNGRTAVKASLSRYVQNEGVQVAQANNPLRTTINTATRTWTDANGDWIPQDSELGPLSNAAFGQTRVVSHYDEDVLKGFGKRSYNWETSVGFQHQFGPALAIDAAYYRRSFGGFLATDNLNVDPSEYDPFCVTVPSDPRLPGGGGNQICGLYDVTPAAQARIPNTLVTFADNYGKQYEYWHGVDVALTARLAHGTMLSGSWSTGKTVYDSCDVVGKVDQPSFQKGLIQSVWAPAGPSQLYCHQEVGGQGQVKMIGSVLLPWSFELSGTIQNLPGPEIRATYAVPNAQIASSLGRNLAAGANGTYSVDLLAPGEQFGDRLTQVDVRGARVFRFGGVRVKGMVDLYNLFNVNTVLVQNNTYGPAWQQPTYIMPGRLLKFGLQFDF